VLVIPSGDLYSAISTDYYSEMIISWYVLFRLVINISCENIYVIIKSRASNVFVIAEIAVITTKKCPKRPDFSAKILGHGVSIRPLFWTVTETLRVQYIILSI